MGPNCIWISFEKYRFDLYTIFAVVMFLLEGEEEGEQYKSQGALAVGSRRYTGELMPSTLCHGGTGTFLHERERKQQMEESRQPSS